MYYHHLFILFATFCTALNCMDYSSKIDGESENLFIQKRTQKIVAATNFVNTLKHDAHWRNLSKATESVDNLCSAVHHFPLLNNYQADTYQFIEAKKRFDEAVTNKSIGTYNVLRLKLEKKENNGIPNIAFQAAFSALYLADYTQDEKAKEALYNRAWNALCLYSDSTSNKKKKFSSLDSNLERDFQLLSTITEQLVKTNFQKFDWAQQHIFENDKLKITHYTSPDKSTNENETGSKFKKLIRKLTEPKIRTLSAQKDSNPKQLKKSRSNEDDNNNNNQKLS